MKTAKPIRIQWVGPIAYWRCIICYSAGRDTNGSALSVDGAATAGWKHYVYVHKKAA